MLRFVIVVISLAFYSGCDDSGYTLPFRDGTYIGTFSIRNQDGSEQSGGATFTFRDGSYSCIPEERYLPPSGAGSFAVHGTIVTLTDNVAHTAEFDWTLILNGDFVYAFDGKTLTLTQDDTKFHRFRTIKIALQN